MFINNRKSLYLEEKDKVTERYLLLKKLKRLLFPIAEHSQCFFLLIWNQVPGNTSGLGGTANTVACSSRSLHVQMAKKIEAWMQRELFSTQKAFSV